MRAIDWYLVRKRLKRLGESIGMTVDELLAWPAKELDLLLLINDEYSSAESQEE